MSEGCTSCENKSGCEDHKSGMFGAIDEALARLYPTRLWGQRDEEVSFRGGISADQGHLLAERLAQRLKTVAVYKPGGPEEYCDFVYLLCLGRPPCIVELREAARTTDGTAWERVAMDGAGENEHGLDELYLRVALSAVAPFAAVQQVAVSLRRRDDDFVLEEAPRAGVFDPPLLPRFQKLVAVLAELDIRHLDFGDLTQPPAGFDAGDYRARYAAEPVTANYFFYPQPCNSVTTQIFSARSHAD